MLDKYRPVLESDPDSTVALELELLGCTHAQLGAYLVSIWGLPLPLVHAVAYHHSPAQTADMQFSSLAAVHFADAIASTNDAANLNRDIELDLNYLDRLGLKQREADWRSFYEEQMMLKDAAKPQ